MVYPYNVTFFPNDEIAQCQCRYEIEDNFDLPNNEEAERYIAVLKDMWDEGIVSGFTSFFLSDIFSYCREYRDQDFVVTLV